MTDQFVPNYVLRFLHHKLPILSSTQNWSGSYMDPAFYELGICGPLKSQNGVLTIVWMCREVLLTVLTVLISITLEKSVHKWQKAVLSVSQHSLIGGIDSHIFWRRYCASVDVHKNQFTFVRRYYASIDVQINCHVVSNILYINLRADQLPRGIKTLLTSSSWCHTMSNL